MIIQNQESTVETWGCTKTHEISISAENLDIITTLLTSNLYSRPKESFLREIMSNAWDSHVEAGNTHLPVIVRVDKSDNDKYRILIRDYGTGLSPERFNSIYRYLGSSTKRHSNDFNGAFGIGRMSALACSSTCTIESYFDKTLTVYVLTKEHNKIDIVEAYSLPTEEENGLGVSITVPREHVLEYVHEMSSLLFFPHVYFKNETDLVNVEATFEGYNSVKIKRLKYMDAFSSSTPNIISRNSYSIQRILVGNVMYDLDNSVTNKIKEFGDFNSYFAMLPCFIKVPVGSVDVTPNREGLIYNKKTIDTIAEYCLLAKQEMTDTILGSVEFNHDSLESLFKECERLYHFHWGDLEIHGADASKRGCVAVELAPIPEIIRNEAVSRMQVNGIPFKDRYYFWSWNEITSSISGKMHAGAIASRNKAGYEWSIIPIDKHTGKTVTGHKYNNHVWNWDPNVKCIFLDTEERVTPLKWEYIGFKTLESDGPTVLYRLIHDKKTYIEEHKRVHWNYPGAAGTNDRSTIQKYYDVMWDFYNEAVKESLVIRFDEDYESWCAERRKNLPKQSKRKEPFMIHNIQWNDSAYPVEYEDFNDFDTRMRNGDPACKCIALSSKSPCVLLPYSDTPRIGWLIEANMPTTNNTKKGILNAVKAKKSVYDKILEQDYPNIITFDKVKDIEAVRIMKTAVRLQKAMDKTNALPYGSSYFSEYGCFGMFRTLCEKSHKQNMEILLKATDYAYKVQTLPFYEDIEIVDSYDKTVDYLLTLLDAYIDFGKALDRYSVDNYDLNEFFTIAAKKHYNLDICQEKYDKTVNSALFKFIL